MRFAPGARVGHFEIQAALGAGGMGEVYRARDTRLDRTVAVKVLSSELLQTPGHRVERFRQEARAIARITHPNICTLHDVGEDGSALFLVMEFVEGATLARRLEDGPLPLPLALRTGAQIADALDHAHRHGVVHRDLKPGNIMLTRDGAKLLDFGLAKLRQRDEQVVTDATSSALTDAGTIVGTVPYMAPEQIEGGEADARTDLFSFGVVLYEMATGRVSFPGNTTAVILDGILNRDPTPPSALNPAVSPELDRIIAKALEKDRCLRYQTAAELRADLQRLQRLRRDSSEVHERKATTVLRPTAQPQGVAAVDPVHGAVGLPPETDAATAVSVPHASVEGLLPSLLGTVKSSGGGLLRRIGGLVGGLIGGAITSAPAESRGRDDAEAPAVGPAEPTPVLLGASAPRRAPRGREFTARFVAHVPEAQEAMAATLASLSPSATAHLGVKRCQWAGGTPVTVALRARGLRVEPASRAFTWDGHIQVVEFDVVVPDDADCGTVVLKFDAAIDGIVVAALRVDLDVVARSSNPASALDPVTRASTTAARTAFASYASEDRRRVLDRVAAVRISAGLSVFIDCLSLHPSEEWRPRLEAEIKARDLFLLFWSKSAAGSEYVSWEWRTALDVRGRQAIQVHPLEAGVGPPTELADLHFGDGLMLARRAEDANT